MSPSHVRRVNGSLVEAAPASGVALYELAHVGTAKLLGEVIGLAGDVATLQVYEDTNGLAVGEPVTATGGTLQAELGPGLLGSILDGLGRPLDVLAAQAGPFVPPGRELRMLDARRTWRFEASLAPGTRVRGGDVLGSVEERPGFAHRILVPPDV
ncbi:MAG: V-type ATP synthase subunit A, partial [Myxococcaceae bacterium]